MNIKEKAMSNPSFSMETPQQKPGDKIEGFSQPRHH
jgi:hypothetical protein